MMELVVQGYVVLGGWMGIESSPKIKQGRRVVIGQEGQNFWIATRPTLAGGWWEILEKRKQMVQNLSRDLVILKIGLDRMGGMIRLGLLGPSWKDIIMSSPFVERTPVCHPNLKTTIDNRHIAHLYKVKPGSHVVGVSDRLVGSRSHRWPLAAGLLVQTHHGTPRYGKVGRMDL
jgi:hypothetical protein